MFSVSSLAALEEDIEDPDFLGKLELARLMGEFWNLSKKRDKVVVNLRDYEGFIKQREKQKARLYATLVKIPSCLNNLRDDIMRDLDDLQDEMVNKKDLEEYLEYLNDKIKPLEKEINGLQRTLD